MTDGNIVDFRKATRLTWLCGACGCSTWYLYNDSTVECAACDKVSEGSEWVTPIQNEPQNPERDNAGSICVVGVGSVELAKRRVMKVIDNRKGEISFIAAWFDDGGMKSWSGAQTPEQRDWVVEKLRQLADHIAEKPDEAFTSED